MDIEHGVRPGEPANAANGRRVLIVSPHFPPSNAPDMHRVRVVLPHLASLGWAATILCVDPRAVAAPCDLWLADTLPRDVEIVRVPALGLGWRRIPGLGGLGWRAIRSLRHAGDQLLAEGGFALVYFSSSVVPVHLLGVRWRRRFGVPFAVDFQDPWSYDAGERASQPAPGGRLKFAVANVLGRRTEVRALRECAGFTATSPHYVRALEKRHALAGSMPRVVQQFAASREDFDRIAADAKANPVFDREDGLVHWVYVGVVIDGMLGVIAALFRALVQQAPADLLQRLRVHFIGTSYAGAARQPQRLVALAGREGLHGVVTEHVDRLPYSDALRCMRDAHALLALGSDDPSYAASKIVPSVLARKPLLAVYHADSPVHAVLAQTAGAVVVPFASAAGDELAQRIAAQWVASGAYREPAPVFAAGLADHTAAAAARKLAAFWDACLEGAT